MTDEKKGILDRPGTSRKLFISFLLCFALALLLEFIIPIEHPHFYVEKWYGFYAVFGFLSFVVLVFAAKHLLRPLVGRREDYYD